MGDQKDSSTMHGGFSDWKQAAYLSCNKGVNKKMAKRWAPFKTTVWEDSLCDSTQDNSEQNLSSVVNSFPP